MSIYHKLLEDQMEPYEAPEYELTGREGDAVNSAENPQNDDELPTKERQADIVIDLSRENGGVWNTPKVEDEQPVVDSEYIDNMKSEIESRLSYVERRANVALMSVGNEGIASASISVLLNIVGHVVKVFSTILFHGWRDFTHSELHNWMMSNTGTWMMFKRAEFKKIAHVKCDIPRGMVGTYRSAYRALIDYIEELDMSKRAVQLEKLIDDMTKDALKSSPVSRYVTTVSNTLFPKYLDKKFDELSNKHFTSSSRDSAMTEELFSNIEDITSLADDMVGADAHLRGVSSVHDRLMNINDKLNYLIKEGNDKVTAGQAKDMADIVRAVARSFEIYSVVMNDLNRINHNFTLTISRLVEKAAE